MNSEPSTDESYILPPEGVRLTQEDVRRLMEEPSLETKIAVIGKVSRHYDPGILSDSEMQIAEQIIRLLVQDSVIRVRRAISESLQENPHIPRDIALTLANDLESVATPMLSMSSVLRDNDLIDLIHQSDELWRYLAIAQRKNLSENVSGSLVNTQLNEVLRTVLENPTAHISEVSFHQIAERAKEDGTLVDAMLSRGSLPLAAVERLTQYVSEDMLRQLREKCRSLDEEQLDAGTRQAQEFTTLELLGRPADRAQTIRLVEQLYEDGRLTASLIINALCQGNLDFFEVSLARLANIPVENAHLLVADKGRLGFRALYNKTQLPGTMYKAVRLLLDSVRLTLGDGVKPGTGHFSNFVVRRMIEMAEKEHVENLPYVLAILRQRQPLSA